VSSRSSIAPVSVVIPCYNCAETVRRAVLSVAAQTQQPAELILVDDASTDRTRRVIELIRDEIGPNWVQVTALPRNNGPATARNHGWDRATQPYVAFLDADDAWHPEKLRVQFEFMAAHPDIALSGHAFCLVEPERPYAPETSVRIVRWLTFRSLLWTNRLATRTVMLRRDLPYRFENGKRFAEDYLLWLQMSRDGRQLVVLDAELAYVYKEAFGEGGLSARLWRMEKGELSAFWLLVKERRLNVATALLVTGYSLAKYLRRSAIVGWRRLQPQMIQ
jgi:glycosyltransferase involved in cell wall biosynthesis